jgi:ribose transport system substrate-binding protein
MRSTRRGAAAVVSAVALLVAGAACSSPTEEETGASAGETSGEFERPEGVMTMEELEAGTYGTPPTTSPPGAAGKSVWWISCGQAAPSCSEPAATAGEVAETLGIDFHVADGKFNAGGAFTTAVRTALAADPDAILLFGVPCEAVLGPLEDAKAQDVLIMGVETPDCSDSGGPQMFDVVEQYNEEYPTTEALWNAFGAYSADYIINETGGTAKVINQAGTEPLQKFVNDGFVERLATCSGCEIVDTVSYDSAKLVPNGPWIQGLRASLSSNPDANAVYLPWDLMMTTLGGAQAVKESGLDVVVFGGQAAPDGLDALRQGQVDAATAARDVGWSAYAAMDTINRALQGEDPVPQGIGFQLVTTEANMPESGPYVPPFDYKAAYEEAWNNGEGTS